VMSLDAVLLGPNGSVACGFRCALELALLPIPVETHAGTPQHNCHRMFAV